MSKYRPEYLHRRTNFAQGNYSKTKQLAWHLANMDITEMMNNGLLFDGPVPPERANEIIGWSPTTFEVSELVNPETMEIVRWTDDDGNVTPMQVVVGRNNRIMQIATTGYQVHDINWLKRLTEQAASSGMSIENVVCLGDGEFLAITFAPSEDVMFGGQFSPKVVVGTGHAGRVATFISPTTTAIVCDNTFRVNEARAKFKVKHTKNSLDRITVGVLREELDISFALTEGFAADWERWANINVTDDQVRQVADLAGFALEADPEKSQRAITMASNKRSKFMALLKNDPRNLWGQTAAGLIQANNTFAQWHGIVRNMNDVSGRIGRHLEEVHDGTIQANDDAFMQIVASVVPDFADCLASA